MMCITAVPSLRQLLLLGMEQHCNNQATHYCDKYLMFIYHDDALWLFLCASFDAKLEVLMLSHKLCAYSNFTTIVIIIVFTPLVVLPYKIQYKMAEIHHTQQIF